MKAETTENSGHMWKRRIQNLKCLVKDEFLSCIESLLGSFSISNISNDICFELLQDHLFELRRKI